MRRLTENVVWFGNRCFNHCVVGNEEAAIIECGVSASVSTLNPQWKSWRQKPRVRFLVAMHAHFDHVCGIPVLQSLFPQSRLLATETAQKILARPKIVRNFFDQDRKMSEVLMREEMLPEIPRSPAVDSIGVDQVIEHGTVLDLDSHVTLEIIGAPGHSPCGVACYLPQDQVMMVSDACGFQLSDSEIFPVFFQSYETYLQTIEKLVHYPTRMIVTAHGTIWQGRDVKGFYQRALSAAKAAHDFIKKKHEEGQSAKNIEETLYSRYYRGDLKIYTPENIRICAHLLVRRVLGDALG